MATDIDQAAKELEERAEKLRGLLKYAPRPFVIEFAGTPKSGKSTSVEGVRHFFDRQGFRVHVLTERAAICPIPMKGHLYFNTWCGSSMLAELLANIETETDIMIVDRGLFDALVWMSQQEIRGELTNDEARTIESFFLLDRWSMWTDLAVLMSVSPEEALARETGQRISRKPGTIMNADVLAAISKAVEEGQRRYHKYFRILSHDTTGEEPRVSLIRLVGHLLNELEEFLNPNVLAVPRPEIQQLISNTPERISPEAFEDALGCIKRSGTFERRDSVENRNDLVQIVAAGVLVSDERVFLFERKDTDPKYRLYGKTTIWQGCHVQQAQGQQTADLLSKALRDRLSKQLFLSRNFPITPIGFCWDAADEQSSHHFGMLYTMTIANPHTVADLKKKHFRRKRGPSLIGGLVSWGELREKADKVKMESWSRTILTSGKLG